MDLFRVFTWDGSSTGATERGPLFVPRATQDSGRHDAPDRYGAWYCSRDAISAVAESIQFLSGRVLRDRHFDIGGSAKALVGFSLDDEVSLLDLDDSLELAARRLRPSQVATGQRAVTQRIARSIFDEGAAGFLWWSTLEGGWSNVTLFHERALPHISIAARPKRLSIRLPEVKEAVERIGVRI